MSIIMHIYNDSLAEVIVDIWNRSMKNEYGFYPISVEQLQNHYSSSSRFNPENILIGYYGHTPQGFVHYDLVDEPGYERAGVISALAVIPEHRHQGVGDKLLSKAITELEKHRVRFIDAAGAWPYSSFYATLIDGSERAGINDKNIGAKWLFDNYYFYPGRKSYTMVKNLKNEKLFSILPQHVYIGNRAGYTTWLDHAFRDWNCLIMSYWIMMAEYSAAVSMQEWKGVAITHQRKDIHCLELIHLQNFKAWAMQQQT